VQDHAYPSLNLPLIAGIPVALPSLPEQHRIVAILDEAFDGIATAKANTEQNLQNARALFESHLQQVFTERGERWVEKPLGEIGKVSMCKRIFKDQTKSTGDIPFYKIGTFGKEADSFIPNEIYSQYREKYPFPKKGDVLISAAGTIGRRVIYDGEHAYFQDSNIVWIDNDEKQLLNHYLYHFYGACEWNSTRGATISRLYNDNLKRIVIPFPKSLYEQRHIAAKLDALFAETQRLEFLYRHKLAARGGVEEVAAASGFQRTALRNPTMTIQAAQFDGKNIRRVYDEETEVWWFSVVDIMQVLTQQPDYQTARKYWNKLKERLSKEGSQSVTNCHRLKLPAADGKNYLTDVATAETLLRLVQSVPSPKAEPIKLWLAKVGYERMQEMADPARSLDRARETWKKHGRSEKWIAQRMTGQETRNKLTDYWANHEIKAGEEFAILTNIIHQEWSGVSVKTHKQIKGLQDHNLRDHMSEAELIFTALAELSARQIAETEEATGMTENAEAATKGGAIAKQARKALEAKTGKPVVTGENFLPPGKATPRKVTKKP
jgi:Restriction endonuclease S subunits